MKVFDAGKARMIGLPYGEKNYDNMLSRFHLTPERHGQIDRRTDRIAISISRVSTLTRDKNDVNIGFLVSENIQIDILHMFLCCLERNICTHTNFQFRWRPSWISSI